MDNFPISSINKVKRAPDRGRYDSKTLYQILDAGFVAHISFIQDGRPFIIPMIYGREHDKLYIHGATTSRMLVEIEKGLPITLAVTHLDALVLARSAFHHSMNYRSAIIYGIARKTRSEDKLKALEIISENMLPGRWQEVRLPNDKEMKATTVLEVEIETASSKIRMGPPVDDKEDYDLDIWAGELPLLQGFSKPIEDPLLRDKIELPTSITSIEKNAASN